MNVAAFPQFLSPWLMADWLEFKILSSEFGQYSLNDLQPLFEELQDQENEDIADADNENQKVLDLVVAEIDRRIELLNGSYPFKFSTDQDSIELKTELNGGAYIYLFCLIISHFNRRDAILIIPTVTHETYDLFQVCATLAGAGLANGSAISFGHPRPEISGFLDALRYTYGLMEEGEIINEIRAGQPKKVKDGKIDVIAWRHTPGNLPGKYYLLGQAAAGANWQEKSVKGEIDVFHQEWFSRQPGATPNPAHFIPFCIDLDKDCTLQQMLHTHTVRFGEVIFRYKLPFEAQKGLDLHARNDSGIVIQRADEIEKIKNYVLDFASTLKLPIVV